MLKGIGIIAEFMAFFEIFRQPPEKHLFVQSRINSLKTFATSTGLFGNTSKENKQLTESFLGKNCLELNGYLSLLYSKELFSLNKLSVDFYKGYKRKATDDPYYKHIFYTSYLSFELLKTLKYDKKQRQIFIAAAQFHDAIEMKNKTNPNYDYNDLLHQMTDIGVDRSDAEKILTIDSLLTPEPKEADLESRTWIEIKNADFDKIMRINGDKINERFIDLFGNNPLSSEESDKLAEMTKQIKIRLL